MTTTADERIAARQTALASVVAAVAGTLTLMLPDAPDAGLRWFAVLVVLFVAAERIDFTVELRSNALVFNLSTIPLIIGLAFATPLTLLAAGLGAALASDLISQGLPIWKANLNASTFWLQSVVAIHLVSALGNDLSDPASWPLVAAAMILGDQLGLIVISLALWIDRGRGRTSGAQGLIAGAIMTVVDTAFGLVIVVLIDRQPWGLVPLAVVAALLASAYRAYGSLNLRMRELRLVHGFSASLTRAVVEERVASNLLDQTCDVLNAEQALIILPSARGVLVVASTDPDRVRPANPVELDAHSTCAAEPATTHRLDAEALGAGEALGVAFPLDSDRHATLVVMDRLGDVRTFDAEDEQRLATLASQAGVSIQNGELVGNLRHLSLHDALTDLPNRRNFVQHLDAALERNASVAVATIDLDDFRAVNDALGYQRGDELLCVVAERLRAAVGEQHVVANIGVDVFAVMLTGVDAADSMAIARTLREVIGEPVTVGELPVRMVASIGLALAPEHATESTSLLRMSDVAMHAAKVDESGVELYDPGRHDAAADRLQLMAELREAIENRTLEVYFQPQIDLRTERAVGAEALVRWRHPERGFIPPDRFIPMAEHTGLIHPLTELVIDLSLDATRQFVRAGHDLTISINISARDLNEPGFADLLRRVVSTHGVRPDTLTLELTETAVMRDRMRSIVVLQEIRAMGIGLAIDDFGKGQSSMAYLAQLPMTSIKIDRDFISDTTVARDAIVRAVVQLGRSFGCKVIAEGIEDQETADALARLDCGYGQGYHYSKPVPAADFVDWVEAWNAAHSAAVR